MDTTHTACGLVEEDCRMVAGTRTPGEEKTRMASADVAESNTTHTRLMWGLEISQFGDESMSNRLVFRVTTHPRDMGGLEDSLFGDKNMSNRLQKSMAVGTMAQ